MHIINNIIPLTRYLKIVCIYSTMLLYNILHYNNATAWNTFPRTTNPILSQQSFVLYNRHYIIKLSRNVMQQFIHWNWKQHMSQITYLCLYTYLNIFYTINWASLLKTLYHGYLVQYPDLCFQVVKWKVKKLLIWYNLVKYVCI